MAFVNFNPC